MTQNDFHTLTEDGYLDALAYLRAQTVGDQAAINVLFNHTKTRPMAIALCSLWRALAFEHFGPDRAAILGYLDVVQTAYPGSRA